MRGDLIETFKIINGISNYDIHSFNISPLTGNLLSSEILKTKSINQLDLLIYKQIYFSKKLFNLIKSNSSVKEKIKLDDF